MLIDWDSLSSFSSIVLHGSYHLVPVLGPYTSSASQLH
jgi:hypothetical protein